VLTNESNNLFQEYLLICYLIHKQKSIMVEYKSIKTRPVSINNTYVMIIIVKEDLRDFSRGSFCYFSNVHLSTSPVKNLRKNDSFI